MRFVSMLLIVCFSTAGQLTFAQSAKAAKTAPETATFAIYMGRRDKGTETYKVTRKDKGYVLTSTVQLHKYGEPIFSEQQQQLAADWSLLHYSMTTKMAREERKTEASATKGKVQMHSESGSDVKSKTVDLRSPALVFDSVVPSQFQVLINEYNAFNVQQPLVFQMLVPQVAAEFSGTLSQSGADKGTFNDHPLELRKYTLDSRGATLQIWTDKNGGLMRVSLPVKNTEFVRTGFKMAGLVEPAKPDKNKSVVMLH